MTNAAQDVVSTPLAERVKIRQLAIGVPDVAAAAAQARKELGLAQGFADHLLAEIGLDDDAMIMGDGRSFLEYVGPLSEDSPIQRWLAKGGSGGYAMAVQVPDLELFRSRIADLEIDIAAEVEAYGYRIIQFRPRKMGLLFELDEVPDPDAWFWDDLDKEIPSAPEVDSFSWVEMSTPEPERLSTLWAGLFETEVQDHDGTPVVVLGGVPVRFVKGPRSTFSAIGFARSASSSLLPGVSVTLDNVRFEIS